MKALLLGYLFIFAAVRAHAQLPDQSPYERVLIPIASEVVLPGAYGSLWVTRLSVRNDAQVPVVVRTAVGPNDICTECVPMPANSSADIISLHAENPNDGAFLYVGQPGRGNVNFSLRIQDIARQAETWGTAIPVVRERDVFTDRLVLMDIPLSSEFRSSLRIYDFDGALQSVVRVRIFERDGNSPLVDTNITLNRRAPSSGAFPWGPGAAFVSDLAAAFPQSSNAPTVRVVVEPVTPGLRIWAFASVTNNVTQHVTVIAPDHSRS